MTWGGSSKKFIKIIALVSFTLLGSAAYPQSSGNPITAVLGDPEERTQIETLAFARSETEVIAHYEDGRVLAWDIASNTSRLVAQTEGAFAYCAALNRLMIATPLTAVLLSLDDGGYATLSEGFYDHAAFSSDCSTLALSEAASRTVELWHLSSPPTLRTAATPGPVAYGITLSRDGQVLTAVAASPFGENDGATSVEVFRQSIDGALELLAYVSDPKAAVGVNAATVIGSSLVILDTHADGRAGLRAIQVPEGTTRWSWTNLDASRITGVEPLSEGGFLVTGNDAGALDFWHIETGAKIGSFSEGAAVDAIAVSGDAQRLSIARRGGQIQIADIATILSDDR